MGRWTAFALVAVVAVVLCPPAGAQLQGDILGSHEFSTGGESPITVLGSAGCLFCHASHSGVPGTPLWGHALSIQTYQTYSSTSMKNTTGQPLLGDASSLCLSCHDGTVAVGQMVPSGEVSMSGSMFSKDVFGTDLRTSHPFSMAKPLQDSANLVQDLAQAGTTADPLQLVKLVDGSVECSSCHDPHNQIGDPLAPYFLVRDASSGQLCLACHEGSERTVAGKVNPVADWGVGIHAVSANGVTGSAALGGYSTVAQFACSSCHAQHGAHGISGLLRAYTGAPPDTDPASEACMTCHNGSTNLETPIADVYAYFAKPNAHPLPTPTTAHDGGEAAVLDNNRHAGCADCHNPHSAKQVLVFGAAPAIRDSQGRVVGVSETDGTTVVSPALNQYENCLRCHGTSQGKQVLLSYGYLPTRAASAADPLNVISQFEPAASSSHPVMHDANSPWPQPSLLPFMLDLDGAASSTRSLDPAAGTRILCTDCHNSEDNREFGGTGVSGPHGSAYSHILERRYEFSQVAEASGPGSLIQNLFIGPDLNASSTAGGPYALCGKCHSLANIVTDASFAGTGGHFLHISEQGFSCSVCHSAHGMGAPASGISGERMVNFDLRVVAPNGVTPVSYDHATNTCTLVCHGTPHNADGSVG